jgi:chemosensory pili system protein ChpA (sensor histidine kinase/response regulator)
MFVDDSLSVRKVGESFLSRMGYDVTVAVDGRDALTKLTAGTFDFVFTDLEMPRMNGFELLREIRRTPALAALPVVVVTSRSADKHRRLAELSGATGYLTKPFTAENLGDMLKRHLAKATAGA